MVKDLNQYLVSYEALILGYIIRVQKGEYKGLKAIFRLFLDFFAINFVFLDRYPKFAIPKNNHNGSSQVR